MNPASVLRIVPSVLLCVLLAACGSSSGGGGGSPQVDTPQLSSESAYPGEFVTITDESVDAGEQSVVEFSSANGYEVSFSVDPDSAGSVRVAVPVYFDPQSKEFTEGAVTVKINNRSAAGTFLIKAVPDLGLDPGAVYVAMLRKNMEQYQSARDYLVQVSLDEGINLEDAIGQLDMKLALANTMADQVESQGTLTVKTASGDVTLGADDLRKLDKWLASFAVGMEAELRGVSPSSAEAPNFFENWLNLNPDEKMAQIQSSIDYTIQEFKRGLDGGKVWIGGITVGFAIAGAFVGGPVGMAVGAAAGLALAYVSAGYELGTAAIYDRVCQSFSQGSRTAYDWSKALCDQAVRIGIAAAGGIQGAVGTVFSWISAAITTSDSIDAAHNARCNPQGGSFILALAPFSAINIQDYCGNDYVIPTDLLNAEISITGAQTYSRTFSPAHVLATFSSISDGDSDVMTGIPTVIGTDLPYTNVNIWDGDVLVIMLHPDEIAGPFPREIEVSDLWLVDGGLVDLAFSTPSLRHDTPLNDVVLFKPSAQGGTMSLEAYGTQVGDFIKGTFTIEVEAELDHWDEVADDYGESDYLSGTISGSFEGILSESPGGSN